LLTGMSGALQIATNVFWLTLVVGFGVWLLFRSLKRSEDATKLVFKWLFTILLATGEVFLARHLIGSLHEGGLPGNFAQTFSLVVSIAACCLIVTITWRHSLIDLVANPIASLYDGGREEIEPRPYYSSAITKRKTNRPLEAIVAIREQLAKFPDDFEGVMLLASIQAEDTKDLPSAEFTLNHFCTRPEAPAQQVAAALTQLADWHLKIAQDADSASATLEKIIARFPETPLAAQAAQRIAHLGGTEKILMAAQDRQAMPVPAGVKNIGLLASTAFLRPAETNPKKLAADLVRQLEQHPLDWEAREKLAVIYARHYQRLDLAALELNQLIDQPDQPAKRVARWLNLLADLQIHGGADYDTVRETLEQIGERFPGLPVAELAQSRLNLLRVEIKGKKETPGVKLGVYEQNIGLKYGSLPRKL
jgi:hypothetical protein